jgi:hypothetical protein
VSLIARAKRERDIQQGSQPAMMLTQSYARNSPQVPAHAFSANPTYANAPAPALPVDPANLASLDANVVDALITTLQQQLAQQTQVAQYAPTAPQQSWPNLGQNIDPANLGQVLSGLSASSGNPVGNPYQQNAPLQAAPGYANGSNVISGQAYSLAHTASSDAGYYQEYNPAQPSVGNPYQPSREGTGQEPALPPNIGDVLAQLKALQSQQQSSAH